MIRIGLSVLALLGIGVILILVTGGVQRGKAGSGGSSKVQTVGLPEHRIEIVGPNEAAFTALISKQLQKTSGVDVNALKSSSAFVVNNSTQSIAALSVKWELLQADGRSLVHYRGYRGRLQVLSEDGPARLSGKIASNDHQLVSLLDVSDNSNRGFRVNMRGGAGDEAHQLSESVKVTISVDGVLFADGTFVGPDTRDLFRRLKAEIEARTEAFEEIARALNGDSEAMKRIETLAKGDGEGIQVLGDKTHPEDQLEKERIARATLAIRKTLGDKAVLERIKAELNKPRVNLRKL